MNTISPQIQRSWTQVSDLFRIENEQDYAYPSCLMYGDTPTGAPVHDVEIFYIDVEKKMDMTYTKKTFASLRS